MINLSKYIFEKLSINKDTKIKDPNAKPDKWEVGDIVVCIFSGSMTLVKFCEIVKRTNKSFTLKRLKDKVVKGDGMQGKKIPIEGEYEKNDKEIIGRVNKWGHVKADSYFCSLWDGEPVWFSNLD